MHLDSFYTFLMAATATAMFVFGLLLQRRREYVTLRAQGLQSREIRRLVLAESGISATLGAVIGLLVGVGMASQFVLVLRPIFTLPPPLEVPAFELATLAALVLGATALSSAAAALLIGPSQAHGTAPRRVIRSGKQSKELRIPSGGGRESNPPTGDRPAHRF